MAFILRRGASCILSNVSKQVQLRALTSHCRYSLSVKNSHAHRLCIYHNSRSISYFHSPLHAEATLPLADNDPVEVEKNEKPEIRVASKQNRKKGKFLQHFNRMISKGEVLAINQAFALLKSCGRHMVAETCSTRSELTKYVWDELTKNGVKLETGMWNTLLSVHIENSHDFEPLDFLKDMWEKSNAEPNKTTFVLLIQAYAAKGDPIGAMKIIEFMMQDGGKMSEHIYGWLVQAFSKSGDMNGVAAILTSMKKNNVYPRHSTYGQLINAYAERGDLERIDETMQEMIKYNILPTPMIYVNLIDHLSIGGHANLIDEVWEKVEDVECIIEDIRPLIQRCITEGNYETALILQMKTNKRKVKREDIYHNYIERNLFTMLKFAEKDINEFLKVSAAMAHHLNQPPFSRVANLTGFLVNDNDLDRAFNVLKDLLSEKKPVTVQMFHPILKGYADKKHIQQIVKTYEYMIDNGMKLDYYCYKMVLPALGDPGSNEYQLFLELIKKNDNIVLPHGYSSKFIQSSDVSLNEISNAVMSASTFDVFGSLKEIKNSLISDFNAADAIEVVSDLHKRGLRNAVPLIESVMADLISKDNKADELLTFLRGLVGNGIPISSILYTLMLKHLYEHNMSDKFFMFVRFMKENGVDPDVHQYYQILKMAATVGNSMTAQFCFENVIANDGFCTRDAYEYLIEAYRRDGGRKIKNMDTPPKRDSENALKVIHLFDEMVEKGLKPSNKIITTVLINYLIEQDIEGANKLIEKYGDGEDKMKTLVKTYMMKAHTLRKEFSEAEKLFNEMKADSTVKFRQYNEMLRLCEFTGDVMKMNEVYQEMLGKGFKPNTFTYLHRIRTYLMAREPEPCIEIIEESLAAGQPLRAEHYVAVLMQLSQTGNVENVKKVIDIVKQHKDITPDQKHLQLALTLVNIKAGNFEDASASASDATIELNRYRKAATFACYDGDAQYIENLIKFFKMNDMEFQVFDTMYLLALKKLDNFDGIQRFYTERMESGIGFNEKFVTLLESIVKERGTNFVQTHE